MNQENVKEICRTIAVYTVKSLRFIKEDLSKKQGERNVASSIFSNDTVEQISLHSNGLIKKAG